MCGIAGIARLGDGPPPAAETLRRMCDTLVHRGPDEEGIDVRDGVGLGMRRLSIIDVAGGHQPYFNEDESVRAVFNGEIYNFRDLSRELRGRGHGLRSRADGEVLVHLWEESGTGFVDALNGMFGIALHDARRRRLVLVRDRLGIKPLYYAVADGQVVFGSELKALFSSGRGLGTLDVDALAQLLAWEYVPSPRTLLTGVRKLEPGTLLDCDLAEGRVRVVRYWDVPPPPERGAGAARRSAGDWEQEADELIGTCVERQLVSDVPLGAFLSGGVDSSLVVSKMGAASTFSIGFNDPSYDETRWSKKVAEHLGVSHRVEILEPRVGDLFERLMPHLDDPIGDFSVFPTYLVSRLAREDVKVVLSGDGGDELFGGYETYLAQDKARAWRLLPALVRRGLVEPLVERMRPRPEKKGLVNKAKRFVEGLGHDERLGHARWRLFVGEEGRARLLTPDAARRAETPVGWHVLELADRAGTRDELHRALYVDANSYLPDNCLVKMDRMSMACSLEARVPLLDHELVEFAFRVPADLKIARGVTKALLKRVAARSVPAECVYRPKEGFSIPIKHWLLGELRPLVEELLDPRAVAAEGLFRPEEVARLRDEHARGVANHSHVLWTLVVFQDWRRRWHP